MTHDFIINTERVNEYGYRIITNGIDTEQYERNPVVLFGHVRGFADPKKVIGKCVKLRKEGSKLIASIEFDKEDEFAKEVAGKVERGFIRMASLSADVIETSIDEKDVLQGQALETVTKCKLVEISIVDIGGNNDALKLSKNGAPIQLKKITKKSNNNMSLKTIALAMGLNEDAESSAIVKKYNAMKLAKEQAETKATGLETELKGIKDTEADALIEKGVVLGLIPEALKSAQRKAFDDDFTEQKAVLSKLISDKEAEQNTDGQNGTIREVVLGNGKTTSVALTFDYLQKHDTEKLREIREKNPDEYVRLSKDYANGVRHKEA